MVTLTDGTEMQMCGVAQSLGGNGQFCRWPGDELRYCIRDQHPLVEKAVWEGEIEWALNVLSTTFQLNFERTDDARNAHIVYTVANLGGPGGVLADAMLIPCHVRKNDDFQSIVRVDALDRYAAEDKSRIGMGFDLGEVLLHEDLHVAGLGHITDPSVLALLNPRYNPGISGLQPPDIEAMLGIKYLRRKKPEPLPPVTPPSVPGSPLGKIVDYRYLPPGATYKSDKRTWLLCEQ